MINQNENVGQLIERVNQKHPDLVEFRLDKLRDPKALEAVAKKKTFPTIVTDKSTREPEQSRELLLSAADLGFEYVDIDLSTRSAKTTVEEVKSRGTHVIVSFHDLKGTPSKNELVKTLNSQTQLGGDICKIVTTALHPRDNLTILEFVANKNAKTRLVSFAMGSLGIPSRILSPLFGSEFTFAALDEESTTAQGQLSIDNLRAAWRLLGIQ